MATEIIFGLTKTDLHSPVHSNEIFMFVPDIDDDELAMGILSGARCGECLGSLWTDRGEIHDISCSQHWLSRQHYPQKEVPKKRKQNE